MQRATLTRVSSTKTQKILSVGTMTREKISCSPAGAAVRPDQKVSGDS
ncbi:hypothetical protein [uncultured Methanofollis sp.]|nr:hypothetical protein [uncultured Methanofollis sp.]